MKIDTLIVNADLFTMEGKGVGYVDRGSVAIDKGKIVAVGKSEDLENEYEANEVIEAKNMMVLPGFVDAHMHASLNIFRGLAQDTKHWMMKGLRPFSSNVEHSSAMAASKVNILEALAAGTTTFGEYSDAEAVFEMADFLDGLGVRANLTVTIRGANRKKSKDYDALYELDDSIAEFNLGKNMELYEKYKACLLYTSPSPRDCS